ncbi:MAG TPA: DUF4349 domain-containing protein [Planctomycetota bacterium]|nr:DUF4349 domain-containing protein [Planctomycetota bacterium]
MRWSILLPLFLEACVAMPEEAPPRGATDLAPLESVAAAPRDPESMGNQARSSRDEKGAASAGPAQAPAGIATPPEGDRLVIYSGSLCLQVAEPEVAQKSIQALTKEMGGWIQVLDGLRLTVRIPARRFDDAFESLLALGQVIDRRVTGSDVTDEFHDLRLRLENSEKVRLRLSAILEQAKNVQDALAVEKELARLTEEIERLKGALARMQDRISYSTIAIELRRSLPSRPSATGLPFPWVRQLGLRSLFHFENQP